MNTVGQRADNAESDLAAATRIAEGLRAELAHKISEAPDPSIAQKAEEISGLRAQLRSQENINQAEKERANTLSARYKVGDLVRIIFHFV